MTSFPLLYAFNSDGLDAFQRAFTGQIDETAIDPVDPHLASPVPGTSTIITVGHPSAKDLAQAVLDSLGTSDLFDQIPNAGLWAWLTFVMRDQLFQKKADGTRKVGEIHRWYPGNPNDWQKAQRHLVRMPVLLLATLRDNADHLLCGQPHILPEIREQLTSQQDMFNSAFQQVARELYFDSSKGNLKRGAGGKLGGTPRRLAKVRQQLDVTWSLEDLAPASIIEKLPPEFSRFRN